ncbi:MAG: VanW family protein [Acidimicrobiales bacterium]
MTEAAGSSVDPEGGVDGASSESHPEPGAGNVDGAEGDGRDPADGRDAASGKPTHQAVAADDPQGSDVGREAAGDELPDDASGDVREAGRDAADAPASEGESATRDKSVSGGESESEPATGGETATDDQRADGEGADGEGADGQSVEAAPDEVGQAVASGDTDPPRPEAEPVDGSEQAAVESGDAATQAAEPVDGSEGAAVQSGDAATQPAEPDDGSEGAAAESGDAATEAKQPAEPELEPPESAEPDSAGTSEAEPEAEEGAESAPEADGELGAEVAPVTEVGEGEPGDDDAGDRLQRQRVFVVAAVALGLVVLIFGGWAVDATVRSGQVRRNVELAGQAVGGLDRAAVASLTADLAAETARRPVTIRSGNQTYELEAAALGLSVDEDATTDAVFDVGRDGFVLLRPLSWASSWFGTDEVTVRYTMEQSQTAAALELAQGAARTAPVEPTMQLGDAGFALVPGQPGTGLEPSEVADALLAEADATPLGAADEPIVLEIEPTRLPPQFGDDSVRALADEANALTEAGLTIHAGDISTALPAAQLRAWVSLAAEGTDAEGTDAEGPDSEGPDADGTDAEGTDAHLDLAFDRDAATAALPGLVGSVGPGPVDATVTLDGAGRPVVVPARDGVTCCGGDAGDRVWEALRSGEAEVEVEVPVVEPELTTEEVQSWGITQPIGGSRAWQSGAEIPGPAPGFTTYHACCASRVTNIHRIADLVRGAVVPPGGDFSINDHVGPRTPDKGFVLAGAIANGQHRDEYGGGVSQFATTTFNAAYFAGLDITSSQAHTEYFSRYPRGREATMGYPSPDLSFHNNTPYGLLIWTSYTETSLTVTIYSTPWATAEQTGISESSYGACRNVSTTRTRTYPDGASEQDSFSATYRPGEGQFC